MNKTILVGRLTKDPELRTTPNGASTCNFSIAVNRPFANKNGEREADFINIIVWNKQAENVSKYCTKGSLVGIDGRIQTRNYEGQDGKKVYVTEVVADNVTFLGSKGSNSGNNGYVTDTMPNYNDNQSFPVESTDISEDPFKNFGSEVSLSDDDLPF